MDDKKTKPFWRSKTIWSGLGSVGIGIFSIIKGDIPTGILTIAGGLGAIFGRATATKEITTKKADTTGL